MKRSIRIDLLGTSFTIQSDEDPAYLRNLVGYYRDKLNEVRRTVNTGDDLKIAILGALTVVDELFKERHRNGEPSVGSDHAYEGGRKEPVYGSQAHAAPNDLSELADRLIKRLDAALDENADDASAEGLSDDSGSGT